MYKIKKSNINYLILLITALIINFSQILLAKDKINANSNYSGRLYINNGKVIWGTNIHYKDSCIYYSVQPALVMDSIKATNVDCLVVISGTNLANGLYCGAALGLLVGILDDDVKTNKRWSKVAENTLTLSAFFGLIGYFIPETTDYYPSRSLKDFSFNLQTISIPNLNQTIYKVNLNISI